MLTAMDTVPCHHSRVMKHLPAWRQFADTQVQKSFDNLESPLSTDSVTIFGLRPPELCFVSHQIKYSRWFERDGTRSYNMVRQINYCNAHLHLTDLTLSIWLDATALRVRLKSTAVEELMKYLIEAPSEDFGDYTGEAKRAMQALFETIQVAVDYVIRGHAPPHQNTDVLTAIFTNFVVKPNSPYLPVPWMNSVRTVNTTKSSHPYHLEYGVICGRI